VFERLLVMCPDQYAVLSAVELVINQRLMRRLCRACGGNGCTVCLQTGYLGRAPLVEWVRVDTGLRKRLRAAGPEAIQPAQTLEQSAREIVALGLSNQQEYERVCGVA
jgi:type II secretory ATPase GspE/PulE/Tfp pilus assembly ATPase PilB-like protein